MQPDTSFQCFPIRGSVNKQTRSLQRLIMKVNLRLLSSGVSGGELLFVLGMSHTHTHTHTRARTCTHTHIHTTFNTQIRTHQNTCKYESTHTWNYAHACRHKQSQLSTAVAWFYVRMAIEAEEVVSQHHSWVQPLISLSLSFCLGLIHSLSLSRPFPELLLVTPSASQTFSVMVLPFGQKNVMNPHHFFF